MKIFINTEPKELNGTKNVFELVEHLGISTKGMALAVNNSIVPKADWEKHELKENDKVTIIRATQGG